MLGSDESTSAQLRASEARHPAAFRKNFLPRTNILVRHDIRIEPAPRTCYFFYLPSPGWRNGRR